MVYSSYLLFLCNRCFNYFFNWLLYMNCKTCQNFIADKVGDGSGIGMCRIYASATDQRKAYILGRLGGNGVPVFWGTPGTRYCDFFEAL